MRALTLAAVTMACAALVFAGALPAAASKPSCPAFKMEGKAGKDVVTFTVTPATDEMVFNWTVSAGTIDSGQGTASIFVSVVGIPSGEAVTASVEVIEGIDASCKDSASLSATVELP